MDRRIVSLFLACWILFPGMVLFAQQKTAGSNPDFRDALKSQTPQKTIDMTDIHDIKAPERPGIDPSVFYYLFSAVIILAVLAGIILYLSRRQKTDAFAGAPVLAPDELAFMQLGSLENDKDLDTKGFYFRLSAILRHYIDGRYGINAPEMTTEEFLPRIEELGLHKGLQQPLRDLLQWADPIKFAGIPAFEDRMQSDLQFVKEFVKQTTFTRNSES